MAAGAPQLPKGPLKVELVMPPPEELEILPAVGIAAASLALFVLGYVVVELIDQALTARRARRQAALELELASCAKCGKHIEPGHARWFGSKRRGRCQACGPFPEDA